ncbi:MAG: Hsp70 family protein, partial [Nitrosopumilaceae archaeon]|nr:Hsp70 family protein [Nitrosopumilaceae archaeon]
IESSSKLSEDEINKLKEDAEKFSDEDKKKKEKVEIKNEAESYIYTTEKLINHDLKDKISQEQGIKVTDAIKEVKEALDKDVDVLKPKLESLKSIVNEITTELYKNVTPPPGAQQGTGQEQTSQESSTGSTTEEQSSTSQQDANKSSSSAN